MCLEPYLICDTILKLFVSFRKVIWRGLFTRDLILSLVTRYLTNENITKMAADWSFMVWGQTAYWGKSPLATKEKLDSIFCG